MTRLVDAVEKNPLLLALAVLWLDADRRRTVADLLSTNLAEAERQLGLESEHASLRELVAHRLLSDRVEELYQGYSKVDDKSGTSLRKAVACATIAGGMAAKGFGLERIEQRTLRNLFPLSRQEKAIQWIAPVRPWVLGDAFIRKVRIDLYGTGDEAFVREIVYPALKARPETTLKAIVRGGEMGQLVADAVARTPIPDDPNEKLLLFGALTVHAALHDDLFLVRAMAVAETLPASLVIHAIAQVELLEAQNEDGRADPLVLVPCARRSRAFASSRATVHRKRPERLSLGS